MDVYWLRERSRNYEFVSIPTGFQNSVSLWLYKNSDFIEMIAGRCEGGEDYGDCRMEEARLTPEQAMEIGNHLIAWANKSLETSTQ